VDCVPISVAPKPTQQKGEPASAARGVAPTNLSQAKLPDRAAFTDELRRRIAETHRTGEPLSVLHFRVKEFTRLEVQYGSAVGSLLLDSLATFIVSSLRDMDLLAKLEGGEFIVMIPGSSASAAKIVGQRVRTSVSLCPIPMGAQQIRLELEMGVVGLQPDDDPTSAMVRAKEALVLSAAAEAEAGEADARRLAGVADKLVEDAVAAV
jgi:diguanylate cyclase (GGDEF)-like protein